jgi:hypothetical protein
MGKKCLFVVRLRSSAVLPKCPSLHSHDHTVLILPRSLLPQSRHLLPLPLPRLPLLRPSQHRTPPHRLPKRHLHRRRSPRVVLPVPVRLRSSIRRMTAHRLRLAVVVGKGAEIAALKAAVRAVDGER